MVLRIHPGIGLARVGDSPDMFVGPETTDDLGRPAGGYRDAEGRIRRQAARFRLFDDAAPVALASGTTIQWTVTLQGATASVSGTDQVVTLSVAGEPVGEIRTDAQGNLLVMSRVDGASMYGCCDGAVQAVLTVGATSTPAVASWVVIAPPDFAPGTYPRLPYAFLVLDWMVAQGLITAPGAGDSVSFRSQIYPAIRGRTALSPADLLALPTAAARAAAVPFYGPRPGEPPGIEGAYLHAIVEHFHTGTFVDDWATPTPLTPSTLDLGPLSFADASCPGWGWELGLLPIAAGAQPITGSALRLDPAEVSAGAMGPFVGWTGDVAPCVLEWITVMQAPPAFGFDWHVRGFMVRGASGPEYVDYWPSIQLLTTELDFGPVQRGSAVARSIEVELANFYGGTTIQLVSPLPASIEALSLVTSTGRVQESGYTYSVPVIFRAELDATLGTISPAAIELVIDGQSFSIPFTGEIVAAETTQLGMVLDCSYSMLEDRGDGISKFQGLKAAMEVVADVARPNDGIAVAPFSDDALPTHTARSLGDGGASDTRRQQVRDFVDALSVHNNTSIGDGLLSARNLLTLTPDTFATEALVVITDGKETEPEWIRNVTSSIDARTFAIGIGTAANVDHDHLRELTTPRGGFLLLTGSTISGANLYVLEKYLLQILAGATNEEVVLDPTGSVLPGSTTRIPIAVTEADFRLDVVVVSDRASELVLALEGPDGTVRTFEALAGEPGVQIVRRRRVGLARVPVPLVLVDGSVWQGGTWHLLMGQRARVSLSASPDAVAAQLKASAAPQQGKPIGYAAVVNARSAIRLHAHAGRVSDASSRMSIEASIGYAGVPLRAQPNVVAQITTPSGSTFELPLEPAQPGRYLAHYDATQPGVYATRVRARGLSPGAHRFTRELTLTPAITSERRCAEPCADDGDALRAKLRRCRGELERILACFGKRQPKG